MYGVQPLEDGEWALGGIGPDKAWYKRMTGRNVAMYRGSRYDATNGLNSLGDIMYTSRGIQ